MTELENQIIDRIKEMMKRRNISQEQLGNEIGEKQYYISRMLQGKPFPSIDQLVMISKTLDCSLYYLIGIQEESYRELSEESSKFTKKFASCDEVMKKVILGLLDMKIDK